MGNDPDLDPNANPVPTYTPTVPDIIADPASQLLGWLSGIGIILAVLGVILLGWFLIRRRQNGGDSSELVDRVLGIVGGIALIVGAGSIVGGLVAGMNG